MGALRGKVFLDKSNYVSSAVGFARNIAVYVECSSSHSPEKARELAAALIAAADYYDAETARLAAEAQA